jgi:uracil DNA glycosylase
MGMSFSVPVGMTLPSSLKNMYKELVNDKNIKNFTDMPATGCLEKWDAIPTGTENDMSIACK